VRLLVAIHAVLIWLGQLRDGPHAFATVIVQRIYFYET